MQNKPTDMAQAFSTLGIGPQSSSEQVRQAYRRLVKLWHPDQYTRNPRQRAEAEARLKTINQAYSIINAYLKTHPDTPAAEPIRKSASQAPKTDFGKPFRAAFHFSGRADTPPQPKPQSRPAAPHQHPQGRGANFRDALHAAHGRQKAFKRSPPSPYPPAGVRRRLKPMTKRRCRSMRIETVEPISKIRPVAPIGPIGNEE